MTAAPSGSEPMHRRRERAESFGSFAWAYDASRPGYPDALIVDLLTRGAQNVLDVACGTGKAARQLTDRGAQVLGVEIDADMAAVARERGVEVEVSGFEDWDDGGRRFDLVTCAQGWHWIDPAAGARKAATVLRAGGTLALFWNMHELTGDLAHAIDAVYERLAPDLVAGVRERGRGHRRSGAGGETGRLAAAGFGPVQVKRYEWQQTCTRDEWLALLATYSDHHLLPADRRRELLTAVGEVIDTHGGTVTAQYETLALITETPG